MPELGGIHHVKLAVSDIQRSVAWYERVFGFKVTMEFKDDEGIVRGFAALGLPMTREQFALRTDDQVAYGALLVAGAGIGFVARYCVAQWPGVRPVLPMLKIPPLPCWLAVHREIRGNRVVRRAYDYLAQALPPLLAPSRSR